MSEREQCHECGAYLSKNSPHGLCPKCLMKVGFKEDADVTLDNISSFEAPGTKIGRYKLLQLIGEGGFGSVYMADQEEPVRRRVALKIIKLGMDTKQVIARFEAERQALAMMDHPNIASVFDGGATDTGRPYFVMELVKGIPITEYCDTNNLDTRQRLELFIDVCKAVQHAHQKGIIHRDIKPSNVMVTMHDGKPVPKIIDFGIAKATQHRLTEKTLFTEYKQFIGTPEYMSPEQAEMSGLDIDTRTDVYSLGVLLYELLTGTTPFEAEKLRGAAYDEIRRIIREDEPPKPSTRLSTLGDLLNSVAKHRHVQPGELYKIVRGDLDWIVMKTLEKDRTRRYETVSELAADVRRHLSHELVSARPPSMRYRLSKLIRRNKALVVGVGSVVVVLVAGIVVSMVFAIGQARARREADRQRRISEAVVDFLQNDFLGSVDPAEIRGGGVSIRQVLDAASGNLEAKFEGAPLVEGRIRWTLGLMYLDAGAYKAAEQHLERAGRIHQEQLGEKHRDTLGCMNNLGLVYIAEERYADAEPLLRETLEIGHRALSERDPWMLNFMENLLKVYRAQKRHGKMEDLLVSMLELQRRTLGDKHAKTLSTMDRLASLYWQDSRYDEARRLFRSRLELKGHPQGLSQVEELVSKSVEEEGTVLAFDDFDGQLGLDWEILNPEPTHYSMANKPGYLTITTQQGAFSGDGTDYENLFLIDSPLSGGKDFQITTCISSFKPLGDWNQAGLICWNDDDNYLKFVYEWADSWEGGSAFSGPMFTVATETEGEFETVRFPVDQDLSRVWLRITKRGNCYTFSISFDGREFFSRKSPIWDGTARFEGDLSWSNGSLKQVGIVAKNGPGSEAPEIDASFDFFEVAAVSALAEPNNVAAQIPPIEEGSRIGEEASLELVETQTEVLAFDDFEGESGLDWEILNPDPAFYSMTKKPGCLTITTQQGAFGRDSTDYKNLFLINCPPEAGEDFQIKTCMSFFKPIDNWNQAGLICWNDEDNYLKFVYEWASVWESSSRFRGPMLTIAVETAGYFETVRFPVEQDLDTVWLCITKRSNRYTFSQSYDGERFFLLKSPIWDGTNAFAGGLHWGDGSVKKAGILAKNGPGSEAPEIDVSFDFFEVRHLLIGSPLPELKELTIEPLPPIASDRMMLICFWDINQRPSRHCILTLAKSADHLEENGVTILAVQRSKVDEDTLREWGKDQNIPFPIGTVRNAAGTNRFALDARSLPWLILADRQHIVRATGFGLSELDETIQRTTRSQD